MKHFPSTRDQWISATIAALLLGGATYVVARSLRPTAPVEIRSNETPVSKFVSTPSTSTGTTQKDVIVHVAGAVKVPGVVHLPAGSRVEDAVKAAGGAASDATLDEINLAAKAEDGTQVYVPHQAANKNLDEVAQPYRGGSSAKAPKAATKGSKHPAAPVAINTASESQLLSIPGVGPSTASLILEYRRTHGGFTSVDELRMIRGIGPKKLEKMRPWIRI